MRPIPFTAGSNAAMGGWVEPLHAAVRRLRGNLQGLRARLEQPVRGGTPCCYVGQRVFEPETSKSFAVDTEQNGASSNLCNYVVRDGQTYRIPVRFSGPGAFVARRIHVAMYQRLYVGEAAVAGYNSALYLPVVPLLQAFDDGGGARPRWTTRFSLYNRQPCTDAVLVSATVRAITPSCNFLWNLEDRKGGRQLSDELLGSHLLMPRTFLPISAGLAQLEDGDFFELDCPWLFERDADVTFLFRPITPMLQFDSSISGAAAATKIGFDDRENGVRRQTVYVNVEVHGHRFETLQDARKEGARIP